MGPGDALHTRVSEWLSTDSHVHSIAIVLTTGNNDFYNNDRDCLLLLAPKPVLGGRNSTGIVCKKLRNACWTVKREMRTRLVDVCSCLVMLLVESILRSGSESLRAIVARSK